MGWVASPHKNTLLHVFRFSALFLIVRVSLFFDLIIIKISRVYIHVGFKAPLKLSRITCVGGVGK